MKTTTYALHKELAGVAFEEAVKQVTSALQAEGFGVITSIDIRATFKAKLDVDHRPYIILGACNPHLAHRALSVDDNVGLLLPCNVVVAATQSGSEVAIIRPDAMLQLADAEGIAAVAREAGERLSRVLDAL